MNITLRMTFVLTVLAGLLLAGSLYAGWSFQERDARQAAERRAVLLGEVLKLAAEAELRDHGKLGAMVDRVARDSGEHVLFFDNAGRAIAPVPTEEDPIVFGRIREVIANKRAGSESYTLGDLEVFVYRTPLFDPRGRVAGALEVRLDLGSAARSNGSAVTSVSLGLLLLFSLASALTSWRWIGRPIRQLRDGLDHVIRGDLTQVLPLDHREEIGRIAYRFNEMTARLRTAQDEIRGNAETKLQLESRLRRSEKLATIGQLSAEIAHEVGTPLNVIGGRARTLERKADQPDEVRKNARIIADQVARITRIIEQVLDLARAPTLRQDRLDLGRVVDEAVSLLELRLQAGRVQIEQRRAENLPGLTGDSDGLVQVVLNLLINAIQAMPAGGRVRIAIQETYRRKGGLDLAPPQHYLALAIADEGDGIPAEHRDRVFDPFFTTKTKGEGTGLGLTVVHGIVKSHDGWIEIAPAEPRGTVFTVYLPSEGAGADKASVAPGEGAGAADLSAEESTP